MRHKTPYSTSSHADVTARPSPRVAFLAALYNRDFRYLWAAYVGSTFVQRMEAVVLGWIVLEMTQSAFLVGLITAVRRLGALLGPWAGVVADRMDRRHLAMTALAIMAAVLSALVLLVSIRRLEVWHLFASTIISGIVWAFFQPAQQSMQADILKPGELANGISLTNMAMNLTTIGGPLLAGVLLACCRPTRRVWDWSDAEMVLSLNWPTFDAHRLYAATSHGHILTSHDYGLSWTAAPFSLPAATASALALEGAATGVQWAYVVMLMLHLMQLMSYVMIHPLSRTARRDATSIWQNLRDGMRYSMRDAGLWTPLLLAGLVNFVAFPLQMNLLPVFARDVFSVGATGLGWLGAALGAGASIGSLLMVNLGTMRRAGLMMLLGTFSWSAFELILALTPSYPMALGILVLTGMAQAISLTNMSIMLLSTSTGEMRGRVMGLRSLAVAPLFLGGMLSGAATEAWGAPMTTMICAGVGMAVTLCMAPWVPRSARRTAPSSGEQG